MIPLRGRLRSRRFRLKLALTLAAVAATYWVGGHLMLTETESLSERFFFIREVKPGEKFPRWSYVTFGLSHPYFKKGKKELLTKTVRCEAGEALKVTDQREFLCNGQLLGRSFERDSKGVVLPQFRYGSVGALGG